MSSFAVAYFDAISESIDISGPSSLRKAKWMDDATEFDDVVDEVEAIGLASIPVICWRRLNLRPEEDAAAWPALCWGVSTSISLDVNR